ncbi:MAG: hypothetical protein ABI416_17235 [Ginsengibacter sp.]
MDHHQNFGNFFHKYLEDSCTPEETAAVLKWLEADEYSKEQKAMISRVISAHPEMNNPRSVRTSI